MGRWLKKNGDEGFNSELETHRFEYAMVLDFPDDRDSISLVTQFHVSTV